MRLQACLNGARPLDTPGLPVTPDAMAAEAVAVRAAGAESLHLHPRAADGMESLAPGDVADVLAAVRAAVPGLPVGLSTGDWIMPRGGRLADMAGWTLRPDFVSVNLAERDALEVIALMTRMGVGVELGLASPADVERALTLPLEGAIRAMIEMGSGGYARARDMARAMRTRLAATGLPILLHGFDDTAWAFIDLAAAWGVQTRIGMEDVLTLPDGTPAGNAAQVAEAARRLSL